MKLDFKKRRLALGLSLAEVSKKTKVNAGLISRYERGLINAGLSNAMKIDNYLTRLENKKS